MTELEKPKQLSIRFKTNKDMDLHKEIKIFCFENNLSMNDFILQALREKLEKSKKK